jgi:hypothetical protein
MEPQKLDLTQCLDSNEFIWPLRGIAQHYAWGRVGSSSAVAKLLAAGGWETIDETKPYAGVLVFGIGGQHFHFM